MREGLGPDFYYMDDGWRLWNSFRDFRIVNGMLRLLYFVSHSSSCPVSLDDAKFSAEWLLTSLLPALLLQPLVKFSSRPELYPSTIITLPKSAQQAIFPACMGGSWCEFSLTQAYMRWTFHHSLRLTGGIRQKQQAVNASLEGFTTTIIGARCPGRVQQCVCVSASHRIHPVCANAILAWRIECRRKGIAWYR